MKRWIVLGLLGICLGVVAYGEEVADVVGLTNQEALLSLSELGFGGYGGPSFKVGQIAGQLAILGGGPFGLALTPNLSVFGSVNYLEMDLEGTEFQYGGIGANYTFWPERSFQLHASGLAGYGWVDVPNGEGLARSGVFILEPEIRASLNLSPFEKIELGGGYRFALGITDLPDLTDADFSGPYATLRLSYGIFDPAKRLEIMGEEERLNIFSGTWSRKLTTLNGQFMMLDGGGTRFIFDRRFALGIRGYQGVKGVDYKGEDLFISYGGLWAHRIIDPLQRIHSSISLFAGVGGVGYVESGTNEAIVVARFILEPDLFADINLTEFLRIGLGVGYRLVAGGFQGLTLSDLSSPTLTLQFRFGGF